MQSIILEQVEQSLVGRVYINGIKTSAYIIPNKDNRDLFSPNQLIEIDNQIF